MEENIKKAFQQLKYEADFSFRENLWQGIVQNQQKKIHLRIWFFSVGSLLSLGALFPVIKLLLQNFSQSGFYQYLSILFSGGGRLGSYWKELAFSLVETLPLASLILAGALLLGFLFSIRFTVRNIINIKQIGNSYAL